MNDFFSLEAIKQQNEIVQRYIDLYNQRKHQDWFIKTTNIIEAGINVVSDSLCEQTEILQDTEAAQANRLYYLREKILLLEEMSNKYVIRACMNALQQFDCPLDLLPLFIKVTEVISRVQKHQNKIDLHETKFLHYCLAKYWHIYKSATFNDGEYGLTLLMAQLREWK